MKNKTTAGILWIVIWGLGAHKFYLGQIGMGILYLVFCWTGIPSIIWLVEGILYLTRTEEEFAQKTAPKNKATNEVVEAAKEPEGTAQ